MNKKTFSYCPATTNIAIAIKSYFAFIILLYNFES